MEITQEVEEAYSQLKNNVINAKDENITLLSNSDVIIFSTLTTKLFKSNVLRENEPKVIDMITGGISSRIVESRRFSEEKVSKIDERGIHYGTLGCIALANSQQSSEIVDLADLLYGQSNSRKKIVISSLKKLFEALTMSYENGLDFIYLNKYSARDYNYFALGVFDPFSGNDYVYWLKVSDTLNPFDEEIEVVHVFDLDMCDTIYSIMLGQRRDNYLKFVRSIENESNVQSFVEAFFKNNWDEIEFTSEDLNLLRDSINSNGVNLGLKIGDDYYMVGDVEDFITRYENKSDPTFTTASEFIFQNDLARLIFRESVDRERLIRMGCYITDSQGSKMRTTVSKMNLTAVSNLSNSIRTSDGVIPTFSGEMPKIYGV